MTVLPVLSVTLQVYTQSWPALTPATELLCKQHLQHDPILLPASTATVFECRVHSKHKASHMFAAGISNLVKVDHGVCPMLSMVTWCLVALQSQTMVLLPSCLSALPALSETVLSAPLKLDVYCSALLW